MIQAFKHLFDAVGMLFQTIFVACQILLTLGQAGQHVANVVKNTGEDYEMTDLLEKSEAMKEKRAKFKAAKQAAKKQS